MGAFSAVLSQTRAQLDARNAEEAKHASLEAELLEAQKRFVTMQEAQKLLTVVSDERTMATLDFVTGVINKTLGEMFPRDSRRISLEKKLHANKYVHINVELVNSEGIKRDLVLQSGTGLRQVISFLFAVCLIEVRKGRRLLLMDELLSGVHPSAKAIIADIMGIFAKSGFQFVMVEYGLDDFGKIYLVEKPGPVATVTPLGSDVYENQVFQFADVSEEH